MAQAISGRTVSYLLVMIVLSVAPLTVVAPLREAAIILVAGWGIWRLHERNAWLRLGGALSVMVGAVLLAL